MKRLILQWHLTNVCNKRCRHCYQENYSEDEISVESLKKYTDQYIELLKKFNKANNVKTCGQINVTGGEPFVFKHIWDLLDYFKEKSRYFDFAVLTNGSLLNEENVRKLKLYNPTSVQISIDGSRKTHDFIRGKDSFEEAGTALKLLHKYKIKALVSFTANSMNYKEFPEVVAFARKNKAYKVWTDRMVPIGNGLNDEVHTLTKEQVKEYIDIIKREQTSFLNKICKLKVGGERSLQFLNGVSSSYKCSAGDGLIILLPDGSVMPCRRLPIIAGNIKNSSLSEIYFNSEVFINLRNFNNVPKGCSECTFLNVCRGGAKCISYGVYKDYTFGDYGCFLRKQR